MYFVVTKGFVKVFVLVCVPPEADTRVAARVFCSKLFSSVMSADGSGYVLLEDVFISYEGGL